MVVVLRMIKMWDWLLLLLKYILMRIRWLRDMRFLDRERIDNRRRVRLINLCSILRSCRWIRHRKLLDCMIMRRLLTPRIRRFPCFNLSYLYRRRLVLGWESRGNRSSQKLLHLFNPRRLRFFLCMKFKRNIPLVMSSQWILYWCKKCSDITDY